MPINYYEMGIAADKAELIEEVLASLDEAVTLISAFTQTEENQALLSKLLSNIDDVKAIVSSVSLMETTTEDINKGTFLGNRKTDIDIALNKTGISETTNFEDAMAIWNNTTNTVYYDKAIATFVDGTVIEVPFINDDAQSIQISTHGAIVDQLNSNTEFTTKLEDTRIVEEVGGKTATIIRITDTAGASSNLERLELNAVLGSFVEEKPVYYWAKTTSSLLTLANRVADVIALGDSLRPLILLSDKTPEMLELRDRIPEFVDTFDEDGNPNGDETLYNRLTELIGLYNKLTELIAIHESLDNINIVGDNTLKIADVAYDLNLGENSNIRRSSENIKNINKVVLNEVNINKVVLNEENINKAVSNEENINNAVENMEAITQAPAKAQIALDSAAAAAAKANEIKAINGEQNVNTLIAGSEAEVFFNPTTGKFTFNIPQGEKGNRGDNFEVNAVGTFANRDLYNTQQGNFSYLATDVVIDGKVIPHIYFKISDADGDWSEGSSFGKGETGDKGIGIASIEFLSTTDASGFQAKSGATDTYKILFTDGSSTTFPVYNGADSSVLSVAGKTGNINLEIADIIGLQAQISNIISILSSDDTTLDEIQELVNYIKQNKSDLESLGIDNIAGLADVLAIVIKEADIGTKVLAPNGDASQLQNLPESGTKLLFDKALFGGL